MPLDLGSGFSAASDLVGGISNFIASQATAKGDKAEAQGYQQAAQDYLAGASLAGTEAQIAEISSGIQKYQQQRQAAKVIGGQKAEIAGAGFNPESGTGISLLRDSAAQSALASALIQSQGDINAVGYQIQAEALKGEAGSAIGASTAAQQSAKKAKSSGIFGAIGSIVGAIGAFI